MFASWGRGGRGGCLLSLDNLCSQKRIMIIRQTGWQVYPCRHSCQLKSFLHVAALTSCACCRRRGRGRVSLRLCTASALRCGARPWGAWGWTPRCAGSPRAACGGRWSTHSESHAHARSWMQHARHQCWIIQAYIQCKYPPSSPSLSFQAKVKLLVNS